MKKIYCYQNQMTLKIKIKELENNKLNKEKLKVLLASISEHKSKLEFYYKNIKTQKLN